MEGVLKALDPEPIEPVVTPLAGLIGAEIDVDLRHIDDDVFGRIRDAFREYVILVFPGQQLSPDDQVAFARRFGDSATCTVGVPATW